MKKLLSLSTLFFLWACTAAPPVVEDPAAARELETFFLRFRQKVQEGKSDSLASDLSRETLDWLEDMRRAARNEPVEFLKDRRYSEALCILALRVERRLNPAFDDRAAGILQKLVVEGAPVRRALLKSDLGPPRLRGQAGEMGLREAPHVPVFFFQREGGAWKFHLARSLPLILLGAESIARQRKPTPLEQAAWTLENFGGRPVLPEDLRR